MKKWLYRLLGLLCVVLFLLNDILNWELVKAPIMKIAASYGVEIAEIEQMKVGVIRLKGLTIKDKTVDNFDLTYSPAHVVANAIKYAMGRSDYTQEFSVVKVNACINDIDIALTSPIVCCYTPECLSYSQITLSAGTGSINIDAGTLAGLKPTITLSKVPIPKGIVSGAINFTEQRFSLKLQIAEGNKKLNGHVKGEWSSHQLIKLSGHLSSTPIDKVSFSGILMPNFEELTHSAIKLEGAWNGTLKDVYTALGSDFKLVQGKIDARWDLQGMVCDPLFSAKASITEGTFEVPAMGLFLRNLSAKVEGSKEYWVVKDLVAHDTEFTKGMLNGSGWFDLSGLKSTTPDFAYCLNLQVQKIAVLMMDNLVGVSSGKLQLDGNKSGATLKGDGLVHGLKLTIDNNVGHRKSPLDIVFKDDIPQKPKQEYPVIFDIDLKMENPAVVEGENLYTTWKGGAHLGGTPSDLRLKGEMKLDSGEYNLHGRDIAIKEGVIRFDGNIFKETSLFAIATLEMKELIAEIIVRGYLDTLSLTLRSNPPLPQREILSWILFNQGARHITALQGEQLNRSLSEFTKGGTKNPLAEIQGRLGIDRIDLDRRGSVGEEEVSLKLGKYLSKNLFVGVSKGINSDVNRIGFEASLNEHWKVQGEIGDNSQGQMHLKWKTDY